MAIDLQKHKIFVPELNMEVVPYSVVIEAMQELQNQALTRVDEVLSDLTKALNHLENNIDDQTIS